MKTLLLITFTVSLLAACGSGGGSASNPNPNFKPFDKTVLLGIKFALYSSESSKIKSCGNEIIESVHDNASAGFKFKGYSSTVACYQQTGIYNIFVKFNY